MKKKILFVVGGSYISGLEIANLHLIRQMKKNGYEVLCLVNKWNDGKFKQALADMDIPFEEAKLGWIYLRKPLWTLDTLAHLPAAFLKSRRVIKKFGPDIIHFCSFASVIMLYPLLGNYHCVYNLQEPHLPTPRNLSIYRLLNKRIDIFTGVSKYIEQILIAQRIPREKIRVVFNGVPTTAAVADIPVSGMEKKLVFGIIGQIVPWKGHHNLIEAVRLQSQQTTKPFSVYIFGNDTTEYAQQQKEQIREKNLDNYFVWKGFVNDQDKIYAEVDAVIVPSLSEEPCSLTILESMMRRKAVIVSDRGGNPELVEDHKTGLIFSAEDQANLAACMSLYLQDRPLLYTLGDNAGKRRGRPIPIPEWGTIT